MFVLGLIGVQYQAINLAQDSLTESSARVGLTNDIKKSNVTMLVKPVIPIKSDNVMEWKFKPLHLGNFHVVYNIPDHKGGGKNLLASIFESLGKSHTQQYWEKNGTPFWGSLNQEAWKAYQLKDYLDHAMNWH